MFGLDSETESDSCEVCEVISILVQEARITNKNKMGGGEKPIEIFHVFNFGMK